jgi:hypothetical protein
MSTNREHWWENTQNAALVVVALVAAIMIVLFIADWTRQTLLPQPSVEEPTQHPPAGQL